MHVVVHMFESLLAQCLGIFVHEYAPMCKAHACVCFSFRANMSSRHHGKPSYPQVHSQLCVRVSACVRACGMYVCMLMGLRLACVYVSI